MSEKYKPVCQYCGKQGNNTSYGTPTGGTPAANPQVYGTCPCHPSGNPNMPHSPRWEKA